MNEVGRVSRIMYLDFINDSLLLGCVDEPQFGGSRCFLQRWTHDPRNRFSREIEWEELGPLKSPGNGSDSLFTYSICIPKQSLTYKYRGFKYTTLELGGYAAIILHPGTPPLTQYSHLRNTYRNHWNIFPGFSQENERKTIHSCVPLWSSNVESVLGNSLGFVRPWD